MKTLIKRFCFILSYVFSLISIFYALFLYIKKNNTNLIIVTPIIVTFLFTFSWLVKKFFNIK